jgi:hypothetical protein
MIYAKPEQTFIAVLDSAPTGLVGTLAVRIENPDGTTVVPQTTSGIVEVEPTVYVATRTAPADGGQYIVVWVDPSTDPDTRIAEDLLVSAAHPTSSPDPLEVEWRPAVQEVASWIRTRTMNNNQQYEGTFTEETQPTDEQAETIISLATAHVASRVGEVGELCSDYLTSQARNLSSLYAALVIELSYFPEQVGTNRSPYDNLKELFDSGIKELREGVKENCGDVPGDEAGEGAAGPAYDFSVTTAPLGREFPW